MAAEQADFPDRTTVLAPPEFWFTIAPSDVSDMPYVTRRIWVGTGGDVALVDIHDNTVVLKNVPSGFPIDGRFKQVRATLTTALDLVGAQ